MVAVRLSFWTSLWILFLARVVMVWVLVGRFGGRGSGESGKEGEDGFCGLLMVSLDCSDEPNDGVSIMGHGASDGVRSIEDVGRLTGDWQ